MGLFSKKVNPNQIVDAIKRNDLNQVASLIGKGFYVNTHIKGVIPRFPDDDYTPLMIAANMGHPEMVSLLIRNGAMVNATNNYGQTALLSAVQGVQHGKRQDSLECVRILLMAGALPDIQNKMGVSPLSAAKHQNDDELYYLLKG